MDEKPPAPSTAPLLPLRRGRGIRPTAAEAADMAAKHEDRVEWAADLVRRFQFRSEHTQRMRLEWGLTLTEARAIASEAYKRVRAELMGDEDRILSKAGAALDWAFDEAYLRGDIHAALKAAQLYTMITGTSAAHKVQVTGDFSTMSPEQLAAKKAEILERLGRGEK